MCVSVYMCVCVCVCVERGCLHSSTEKPDARQPAVRLQSAAHCPGSMSVFILFIPLSLFTSFPLLPSPSFSHPLSLPLVSYLNLHPSFPLTLVTPQVVYASSQMPVVSSVLVCNSQETHTGAAVTQLVEQRVRTTPRLWVPSPYPRRRMYVNICKCM